MKKRLTDEERNEEVDSTSSSPQRSSRRRRPTAGDDSLPPPPHKDNRRRSPVLPQRPPPAVFKKEEDDKLIRLALHQSPFFTCLDAEQVDRFVEVAQLQTFAPGQIVILEGCGDDDDDDEEEEEDRHHPLLLGRRESVSYSPAEAPVWILEENDAEAEGKAPQELADASAPQGQVQNGELHLTTDSAQAMDDDNNNHSDTNDTAIATETAAGENLAEASKKHPNDDGNDDSRAASTSSVDQIQKSANLLQQQQQEAAQPSRQQQQQQQQQHRRHPTLVEEQLARLKQQLPLTIVESAPSSPDDSSISSPLLLHPPAPPRSGQKRAVYIVRKGNADIYYNNNQATTTASSPSSSSSTTADSYFHPASLVAGQMFGEGGFLFGRQHSASVVASMKGKPASGSSGSGSGTSTSAKQPLECWVVGIKDFRDFVLPSENMTQLFEAYASHVDKRGVLYMTMDDFVQANHHQQQQGAMMMQNWPSTATGGGMVAAQQLDPLVSLRIAHTYSNMLSGRRRRQSSDPSHLHNNRIYLADFCLFHLLMARPDPEVDIAFMIMDQNQTGQISLNDLAQFIQPIFPQLDLQAQFFQRYFGRNGRQTIRQHHFSQFFLDLQREMGKQAFLQAIERQPNRGGEYLGPSEFVSVLKTACGWRLPKGVGDRLERICGVSSIAEHAPQLEPLTQSPPSDARQLTSDANLVDDERESFLGGSRYFVYGDFIAFQEVLDNLPGICSLIDRAEEIKQGPVSSDDFKVANRVLGLGGRLSRRQVEIIFSLFDLDRDGYISHGDTMRVCGIDFSQRLEAVPGRSGKLTFAPPPKYRKRQQDDMRDVETHEDLMNRSWSQTGNFGLSAIASALGVVAFYPLEVAKTLLMNQRPMRGADGRLYAHSLDCLRQAFRAENIGGLYRGLAPELLGVVPEKVIKLQVNELLRLLFSTDDETTGTRKIDFRFEVLAGACAGASQLLITTPVDLTKTRLILRSETLRLMPASGLAPPPLQSLSSLVRELGFPGIYLGASACLMRDIPFSAIYFPAYAALKEHLSQRKGSLNSTATLSDVALAGTLAGVPAALLTTPCDVIRVRVQAMPRQGQTTYAGIRDCASKILQNEGIEGFFKGASARLLRIAPQFGISLVAYEQLSAGLGLHRTLGRPLTDAPVDPRDYRSSSSRP